jgi:hypothetical protein
MPINPIDSAVLQSGLVFPVGKPNLTAASDLRPAQFANLLNAPNDLLPTGIVINPANSSTVSAVLSGIITGAGRSFNGTITRYPWVFPGRATCHWLAPQSGAVIHSTMETQAYQTIVHKVV